MTNILYTARAGAVGGREGRAASDDGRLDVRLATPKELGGAGGDGTNPEQLFAAGYSACFESALRHVARLRGKPITDSRVSAEVGIGPNEAGGFGLAVALTVELPGLPREEAEALTQAAHAVCPYSNAVRGNIDVKLGVAA